jgi:hypothetical protein
MQIVEQNRDHDQPGRKDYHEVVGVRARQDSSSACARSAHCYAQAQTGTSRGASWEGQAAGGRRVHGAWAKIDGGRGPLDSAVDLDGADSVCGSGSAAEVA